MMLRRHRQRETESNGTVQIDVLRPVNGPIHPRPKFSTTRQREMVWPIMGVESYFGDMANPCRRRHHGTFQRSIRVRSVAWSTTWHGSTSRRKISAGWSCGPRSNRRRWLSRLRKRLRTRRQPLNSAILAKQVQSNSETQAQLVRQQAAAAQQKADQATQQASVRGSPCELF